MPHPPLSDLLDLATEVAFAGGRSTLGWFQAGPPVEIKDDLSPVTLADRQAEERMRELILRSFPHHGVLGEEFGETNPGARVRWILDPIDGTKTFVAGVPLYGTLVGVEVDGESVVGVIEMPALDERVVAGRGLGARWNGRPCQVSRTHRVEDAIIVSFDTRNLAQRAPGWDTLQARARFTRTWGDCYGYLLVATGRADGVVDAPMAIWDNAALLPVIEEAGGRFTDWRGARRIDGGNAVASNGLIHEDLLDAVANAPDAGRT